MARARQSKQVGEGPAQVGAVAGRHMSRGSLDGRRHTHTQRERKTQARRRSRNAVSDQEPNCQPSRRTDRLKSHAAAAKGGPSDDRRSGTSLGNGRYWKPITQSKSAFPKSPKTPARPAKIGFPMASNQQHGEATRPPVASPGLRPMEQRDRQADKTDTRSLLPRGQQQPSLEIM